MVSRPYSCVLIHLLPHVPFRRIKQRREKKRGALRIEGRVRVHRPRHPRVEPPTGASIPPLDLNASRKRNLIARAFISHDSHCGRVHHRVWLPLVSRVPGCPPLRLCQRPPNAGWSRRRHEGDGSGHPVAPRPPGGRVRATASTGLRVQGVAPGRGARPPPPLALGRASPKLRPRPARSRARPMSAAHGTLERSTAIAIRRQHRPSRTAHRLRQVGVQGPQPNPYRCPANTGARRCAPGAVQHPRTSYDVGRFGA
jgi:hypothetical protein